MSKSKIYTVSFKRKREGKTDYPKRLNYLKSDKTRFVIRVSTNNLSIQAVDYHADGDKITITVKSSDLKKYGWKYSTGNIPSSYLTGLLFGNKIKEKIKEGIIDLGLNTITKGTRVPAAIKGIIDSGIGLNYDESILPSEEAITGKRIVEFANLLLKDEEKYKKQFSKYLKENQKPELMVEQFEKVKIKINGE
jgi:large subunit ribosomal protein L18